MKHAKLLIFSAIIVCLCIFSVGVDVAHAATKYDGTGYMTISPAGVITGNLTGIAYWNTCSISAFRTWAWTGTHFDLSDCSDYGGCGNQYNGYSSSADCFSNFTQDISMAMYGSSWTNGTYRTELYLYTWSPSFNTAIVDFTWNYNNGVFTPPVPPGPSLSITSPVGGTTITSNAITLTGTYASLNVGELGYGYLHIELKNPNNGLYSQVHTQTLTAGSGSFSFPISDFGITENGTWDLVATQEMDANTFQDLTPSYTYSLNFNIGGNSAPYTFTNWNTWYTANSAGGYSAPSDFGNSIEGFFQPIFTNVYEFANNTLSFFNATTAHDKGYQIGQIFPTAQAYLNNINVFFGGFPLVPFFEFMIVVMLGIFIVRTIFKFIPFFG